MTLREARLLTIPMFLSGLLTIKFLWVSTGFQDWNTPKAIASLAITVFCAFKILTAFYHQHGWPEEKK